MGKFNRAKKDYTREFEKKNIVKKYKPKYNYENLEVSHNDKKLLVSLEEKIGLEETKIGKITYEIGEALEEARKVFKKYSTEENDPSSYVSWYLSLGLNKDQAYIFRGRYRLGMRYPEQIENILGLSNRAIKEVIHKKTPIEVEKKVIKGELVTGKEIVEERKKLIEKSSTLEILSKDSQTLEGKVVDAQIVEGEGYKETMEEKKKRIEKEIKNIDRDIKERERNLKKLKKEREKLAKLIF